MSGKKITYVAHTCAGYGAQIADDSGPIVSYGCYYSTPYSAENDAIDWAEAENCEYSPFNWVAYNKEMENKE